MRGHIVVGFFEILLKSVIMKSYIKYLIENTKTNKKPSNLNTAAILSALVFAFLFPEIIFPRSVPTINLVGMVGSNSSETAPSASFRMSIFSLGTLKPSKISTEHEVTKYSKEKYHENSDKFLKTDFTIVLVVDQKLDIMKKK